MAVQDKGLVHKSEGWERILPVVLAVLIPFACRAAALEADPFEAVLMEINANPPKALEDLPKERLDLLRRIFTEYTNRLPSFAIQRSAIPSMFDRNIVNAMVTVAKLCEGKPSGFILDLFGKPRSALALYGPGSGIIEFRVGALEFLEFTLRKDVVVASGVGCVYSGHLEYIFEWAKECAIRPGRLAPDLKFYTCSVAYVNDEIAKGRVSSLKELSEDQVLVLRLAFGLYFGAIRSNGPSEASVWNDRMAEGFERVVPLCKGWDCSSIMELFGKPTAVRLLGPRRLALTYRFAEKRQADLHFDEYFRLTEVVSGDVVEKK